jgi:hypothetical protein
MQTFWVWFRGLLSVAISSAAGGVTVVVVDPATFNFSTGFVKLAQVCGVLALIHAALYLQKSPLPGGSPIPPEDGKGGPYDIQWHQ